MQVAHPSPRQACPPGVGRLGKGTVRAANVALFTLVTLLSACFDNPKPECGFGCGPNDECPSDYVCNSEKRCQLESAPEAVCPGTESTSDLP